jgi:hypothetical protein
MLARIGLGLAGPLELGVEGPLVLVELAKLLTHLVHPAGQGSELVAIRHVDGRAEVAFRDPVEEAAGRADGEDEGPGDDEAQEEGKHDRRRREAAHDEQGSTVHRLDALPELGHPGLFAPDDSGDEGGDLPIQRIALVEVECHRLVELAVPIQARDARHRGQELVLGRANPLDRLALSGWSRSLQAGERVLEAVLLAEDALDGGVVPKKQRIPREVHLQAQGLLDLAGGVDPLAGLVQEPALPGHAHDRLEAHRPHGDEEQGDQEERAEELRVDGRADAGDAPDHGPQRRAGHEQARDPLAQAQRRLGDGDGGLDGRMLSGWTPWIKADIPSTLRRERPIIAPAGHTVGLAQCNQGGVSIASLDSKGEIPPRGRRLAAGS